MVAVEIAVEDMLGARIARDAGADRLELCANLASGGLTPTQALVEAVVAEPTHPRAGDGQVPNRFIRTRAG